MMQFNVNVFKGGDTQYTVKVFKMFEDDLVMIPEGSQILASEVVDHKESGNAQVWVWAAVPNDNMGVATGTKNIPTVSDRPVNITGEPIPEVDPRLVKLRDEYLVLDDEVDELNSQWAGTAEDYIDDEPDDEDSSEDDD